MPTVDDGPRHPSQPTSPTDSDSIRFILASPQHRPDETFRKKPIRSFIYLLTLFLVFGRSVVFQSFLWLVWWSFCSEWRWKWQFSMTFTTINNWHFLFGRSAFLLSFLIARGRQPTSLIPSGSLSLEKSGRFWRPSGPTSPPPAVFCFHHPKKPRKKLVKREKEKRFLLFCSTTFSSISFIFFQFLRLLFPKFVTWQEWLAVPLLIARWWTGSSTTNRPGRRRHSAEKNSNYDLWLSLDVR